MFLELLLIITFKIEQFVDTITDSVFVNLTSTDKTIILKSIPTKSYKYIEIANSIEQQIYEGVLKLGDKLPSLRVLQHEYGVSISTILQAYYQLEAISLIEPKAKSGYFVIFCSPDIPKNPVKSNPDQSSVKSSSTEIIVDFFQNLSIEKGVDFSLGVPSKELLPIAKLNKVMHEAVISLPLGGSAQGDILGRENLRRQIARRSILWGGKLTENDVIITSGCTSALSFSLITVTKPGDTIAVESPVYFGLLQLAKTLRLRVLELPTDPLTGIDLNALEKAIDKNDIKAIAIISNFNNPMGNTMSDDGKKALVKIIQKHNIPLIEDDIYGDIYYDESRPTTCKTYDDTGLVILCGSFSKTLASGYRVGWLAPGKYFDEIVKLKLYLSSTTATITEEALALFLEKGRYDHHLRKLRQTLHANSLKFLKAIVAYFPKDTRVSKPKGGFLLWVELAATIDTEVLYKLAECEEIRFFPGKIFTLQNQYTNCLRLSYGLVWNEEIDNALYRLGMLIKNYEQIKN